MTSIESEIQIYQEPWMVDILKQFILSTSRVWRCMYDNHISVIKKTQNIDVSVSKTKISSSSTTELTRYIDYAKNIRDFKIKLPDWFLLSNGTIVQKIIPCYDADIDMMPLVLIDLYFAKDRTFILAHMTNTMIRNGMHVSDVVTRCIFKCFSNPYCLSYIRNYITSPERCFLIQDHYVAYYEHLKFAILDKNVKRMVLLSSRQIFIMIEIIRDSKEILINDIMLIDAKRGKECKKIICGKKNWTKSIFKKLWPNLEIIILLKDGCYRLYTDRAKNYVEDVMLYSPIYFISETTLGYNLNRSNTYVLDPTKGYFEFIKITDNFNDSTIPTVGIRHLNIGDMYNIVVSTATMNLNRYITGEIVRVINYFNGSPEIEIVCRETDIIYNNDDIITPDMIENILQIELHIVNYCYRHNDKEQLLRKHKIKLYVELDETNYLYHDRNDSNDSNNSNNSNHNMFDNSNLSESVYDVSQTVKDINICGNLLDKLGLDTELRIVKPQTFEKLHKCRYSEHIDPALVQVPKMITDVIDFDILRDNILYMY